MVSELSSSDEPMGGQKRKETTNLMRNTWNALTPKEKKSRIKKAIKKAKNRTVDCSHCVRVHTNSAFVCWRAGVMPGLSFMASIIRCQHSMVTVSKAKGHSLRELIHLVIQNEVFLTK